MTGEYKYESTFRVGRYKCCLTCSKRGELRAEWEPNVPDLKSLSEEELKQYRAARNEVFARVLNDMGGSRAVIVEGDEIRLLEIEPRRRAL